MSRISWISGIEYATVANFSPRGKSELSIKSKNACYNIKNGKAETISNLVRFIVQKTQESQVFDNFLGSEVIFVPAPSSSLLVSGGLWPSQLIAEELVKVGLGKKVVPYLKRAYAIPKSSIASAGQRATVQEQYDSLSVNNLEVFTPTQITIIDDVLTKGRTSFACAQRLAEAFPITPIRLFCPMRTQGLTTEIVKYIDLANGEITFDGYDVHRNP